MKIQDLLERIVEPQITNQRFKGTLRTRGVRIPGTLGQGHFSTVNDHKTDPHMVRKHNHRAMGDDRVETEDGFEVFIRQLIKLDLMDNIHFPKVYVQKKITDRGDSHINKFEMERLIPVGELSDEEWEYIVETNFTEALRERHKKVTFGSVGETLGMCLDNARHIETYIKLDTLKEAMTALAGIIDRINALVDMHAGNYMFRRTPHGLQLVITDPISAVVSPD